MRNPMTSLERHDAGNSTEFGYASAMKLGFEESQSSYSKNFSLRFDLTTRRDWARIIGHFCELKYDSAYDESYIQERREP